MTDAVTADIARMKNSLAAINGKKITVGIHADVGGDILRYAAIHEFGGTITAKNVKNLAIPLTKEAKQKSPRDIEGLFFIKSKKGKALLVRDKRLHTKKGARRKNAGKIIGPPQESELEPLYVLKHSVTIPERSYIRASFDNGRGTLDAIVGQSVDALLFGGVAPSTTLERIGVSASQMTRQYINDGKIKPPTGELARSLKTQETTLFDQGRLVGSIAHKVE